MSNFPLMVRALGFGVAVFIICVAIMFIIDIFFNTNISGANFSEAIK